MPFLNKNPGIGPDLQEVAGVTVTALQEPSPSLLGQEAGHVARDPNVEAVQDR